MCRSTAGERMESSEKIALVVTGLFFLVIGYLIVSGGVGEEKVQPDKKVPDELKCTADSDCVPGGECCHPSKCVNQEYAQEFHRRNCREIFCTEVCMPCPECKCIEGRCMKTGEISVREGGCC